MGAVFKRADPDPAHSAEKAWPNPRQLTGLGGFMLSVLVIFMMALPVLAVAAPPSSSDLEIREMLKRCAEEQARLSRLEE